MLFKTKKEMLAQNGKERKQLPVSPAGFLKGGALSSPLASGGLGLRGHSRYAGRTILTPLPEVSEVEG